MSFSCHILESFFFFFFTEPLTDSILIPFFCLHRGSPHKYNVMYNDQSFLCLFFPRACYLGINNESWVLVHFFMALLSRKICGLESSVHIILFSFRARLDGLPPRREPGISLYPTDYMSSSNLKIKTLIFSVTFGKF